MFYSMEMNNEVEKYFLLNEPPFRTSPDPRFLYLTPQVQESISRMQYMTINRVGPLYITGQVGSGKTSILRRFYQELMDSEQYRVSPIISPNVKTSNAFLRMIMGELHVKTERAYDQSLKNFSDFLIQEDDKKHVPVLLLDEAQNLTRDALRLIHYLLNFETNQYKLLQVLLVGQEELAVKISRFPELSSRMFPVTIAVMDKKDIEEMVAFRWMVAGGKREALPFSEDVYDVLHVYSKGLPRDIVKMCDMALLEMFAHDKKTFTGSEMETLAITKLKLKK